MKSSRFWQYGLAAGILVFLATGLCFAQAASPSTPEEKKAADEANKKAAKEKGNETAELELSEPVPVIATGQETEKSAEEAVEGSSEADATAPETKGDAEKTDITNITDEINVPETKKVPAPVVEKR